MQSNVSQREKWITVEGLAVILAKGLAEKQEKFHLLKWHDTAWTESLFATEILGIMLNHGIAGIVTLSEDSDG